MGYRLRGTYVTNCNCRLVCPCTMDGKPTGPNDECMGVVVFQIADGNLDDLSLSGVAFAFYNVFPSNFTSGKWKIQLVIDEKASDEQAEAVMRIFTGQEGGFFAEFVPLVDEVAPTERAPITFVAGAKPSATIGARSTIGFEPAMSPDGVATTVKNTPFGFAAEYQVGSGGRRLGRSVRSLRARLRRYGGVRPHRLTSAKSPRRSLQAMLPALPKRVFK